MKTRTQKLRLPIAALTVVLTTLATSITNGQIRQQTLYIDDATGLFTQLKSVVLGGSGQCVWIPNAGSGATTYVMEPDNASASGWAANDLFYASSSAPGIVTRLPKGTANQVFTVNSGATGYTWTTLSAATSASGVQTSSANPAATTSTTGVMAGLSHNTTIFTPSGTGKALVVIEGTITTDVSTTGPASVQIRYGSGGTGGPANGAGPTGTALGGAASIQPVGSAHAEIAPFACVAYVALTPGTAYWFDADFFGSVGTTSLSGVQITVVELP